MPLRLNPPIAGLAQESFPHPKVSVNAPSGASKSQPSRRQFDLASALIFRTDVYSPRYTARAVQVSATTTSVNNGSLGFSFRQIHAATTSLVGFSRPEILFK